MIYRRVGHNRALQLCRPRQAVFRHHSFERQTLAALETQKCRNHAFEKCSFYTFEKRSWGQCLCCAMEQLYLCKV